MKIDAPLLCFDVNLPLNPNGNNSGGIYSCGCNSIYSLNRLKKGIEYKFDVKGNIIQ